MPAVALLLGNIAYAQLRLGRLSEANASIAKGMTVTARPEAAAYRPQLMAAAAAAALEGGDGGRAEALIARRFASVDLTRTILPDRDAHEIAYRIYSATENDGQALRHLAALKRLDDQATEIARSTGAALAAARFDYTSQELQIARLKADDLSKTIVFERESARTQRIIFVGAAGFTLVVVVLLAIGIVTARRSRDRVRAANDDLAATNLALAKALRVKTEFLATTSHEIRTPLNGILGMTQVMAADVRLDPVMRERLDVVHGAGLTMRGLVDDILDVAKIESGRMTIEAVPFDLPATVEEATRMWREQATAKGLAFAATIDVPTRRIVGDAARLRQIVFNLLSNAVKFTARGRVSLAVVERDGRIELTVSDTGIGIASDAHEAIFESFRQADAGTTRQFGGTGLGLSICRNLSRAMGGDVTVASRPGDGATFTLALPLVPAAAPDTVSERASLLIVVANPIQRAMFRALFAHVGPLAFADDAAAARVIGCEARPERVLVDAALVTPESLALIVEAAAPAVVHLLAPECDPARRMVWLSSGVAQVIERPVGKKTLVSAVLGDRSALVPVAA